MKNTTLTVLCALFTLIGTACVAQNTSEKTQEKMKVDFIGFSDDIVVSYANNGPKGLFAKDNPPFDLLSENGYDRMKEAVLRAPQGSNTCALYALDVALDRIKYVQKHYMDGDPKSKYYIVMLTDGLDNKSLALAESKGKGRYTSREAYGDALQTKMNDIMHSYAMKVFKSSSMSNAFQSYVLLYKGHDIKESGYTDEQLTKILSPFTGAQNTERPAPILDENLDTLLKKFEGELISRSYAFNVQKDYAGKRIRMLFNEAENEKDQIYFEADLVRDGSYEYYLDNIKTSPNFTAKVNSHYDSNNTALIFTLSDLRLNDVSYPFDKEKVTQWVMDYGKYRKNSEYSAKASSIKNAYIIVLLDGSTSFQEKYADAQNAILEIIKMVGEL